MKCCVDPILRRVSRYDDHRGWFLSDCGSDMPVQKWVMHNVSFSNKNVVRGLHYQRPYAQNKLLTVLQGSILDVILDLNPDSESFGQWQMHELSAEDNSKPNQIFIPNSYAHGFSVPKQDALVSYSTDVPYHPDKEYAIDPFDRQLAIPWGVKEPVCSEKDMAGMEWDPCRYTE